MPATHFVWRKMEEIYERLNWFYGIVRNAIVLDAHGYSYRLFHWQLTQLSRGEIPYPKHFQQISKYEQDAILQNFT